MDSAAPAAPSMSLVIRASSTSFRIAELKSLHEKISAHQLPEQQLDALLPLLFETYPAYKDRPSRQAVQACLESLIRASPARTTACVRFLKDEAAKAGLAPSNAFVLLEWCSLAIQLCSAGKASWDACGAELLTATARLLDLLISLPARRSIKQSALVVIRRALRKLFTSSELGLGTIEDAVTHLTAKANLGNRAAVLLGVIAGVCARLGASRYRGGKGDTDSNPNHAIKDLSGTYYTFWAKEVIGSKSKVPDYIANAFEDFFSRIATIDGITRDVVPAIEKSLLRSPEVVLNDLVGPIVTATPSEFDWSDILASQLLKPLLSNLRSTNAEVRNGAAHVCSQLLRRSNREEALSKVTTEVLTPLASSKLSSADHRILYANILRSIRPSDSLSKSICSGIAPVAIKEPNEPAAAAEVDILVEHLPHLILHGGEGVEAISDAFSKGLGDKRAPYQRLWALRTGDILLQLSSSENSKASQKTFAERVAPKLLLLFNESMSNAITASQSGVVAGALVAVFFRSYLSGIIGGTGSKAVFSNSKILDEALAYGAKPSFLLNLKAYTKITSAHESLWLTRALFSCASSAISDKRDQSCTDAWVQACLYVALRANQERSVRQEALSSIQKAYKNHPKEIASAFIKGLWTWYRQVDLGIKDTAASAAQSGVETARQVLRALNPLQSEEDSREMSGPTQPHLIHCLVLCRPEILPGTSWIETCLSCKQDPGELVSQNTDECFEVVNGIFSGKDAYGPASETMRLAACNAFAELAFVAPKVVTPKLKEQFKTDMAAHELAQLAHIDFAIARTPEGTAYVDVLSTKSAANGAVKGRHDYDTLKWEEDLRAELAAKKGQQRKLTADEQSRVKAQIEKESKIRRKVLAIEESVRRGIGVVKALASGPPTDAGLWIEPAVTALLSLLEANVGLLVGRAASDAYLACANLVSSRLGSLRPFIGVATARIYEPSSSLDESLLAEPIGNLVTRILYRIRFAGEQRPFDSISLTYMIPLVCVVLQKNGVGFKETEEKDEQVTLALEFLSSHMEIFSDEQLPRTYMISVLIMAMQTYTQHYKLIKDCLFDLCRATAASLHPEETTALLAGAIVPETQVRAAVLQAVREFIDLTDLDFSEEIFLAIHDDDQENAAVALAVWEENALEVIGREWSQLTQYLESSDKALRRAAARSIAACVRSENAVFRDILTFLEDEYREKAKPRVPERDAYGMIKKTDLRDPWEARSGIALAFKELAFDWEIDLLVPFVQFMVESNALGDKEESVRDDMIESAVAVISKHGSKRLEQLMKMFETALEQSKKDSGHSDLVNEAVVILYGALAQHLKQGDSRVPKVVRRLLQTLSTPSETVQYAVAGCLPPLIRTSLDHVGEYVEEVLNDLTTSKQYAARRGAAYGLAGIVSGKGLIALRENRIMASLKAAAENKKDPNGRQGALFAFELMSLILGRTFEPYVIQIVPNLISGFGDTSAEVREACLDASKKCFASLSSYGVKIILPMLLEGLDEPQWRSKRGACDLLGAMAYLDPEQLARSLPDIIPPLTNVLNDSHKEVRTAANRSLQRFGDVISNPEIKSLAGILLKALSDPTKHTDDALDALIKISFVHYLDAPSLALVVRILERGLGDRSATKRKASQIIGSLAHLTERKDITTHLPLLVAGLRTAIIDPVPTTRATSSKALGSLVEKLGEDALPDLIPSLMATLRSESGAGDRLGSAQALSEVLAGLGTARLEETLPSILQNVSSAKPSVREGFMTLFIFLPACFGNSFANYLNRIIPPILEGLADEVESIREISLRAGRLLVKNFATRAIDLLLPELDRGLADDSHRIRLSSVELVGDLLFNLTGITGGTEGEQEEEQTGATEAGQSLLEVLGEEKRNKILSSLYICRNDTSGLVRSAAVNVWKALVATPRTLKELIPTLTQSLIKRLASSNMEQKVIAGNALGELIRKAGEGVLATLLPTLEEGLQTSTDKDNKQGICIALREIINAASPDTLEDYEKTLISIVRSGLVDSDDDVRETAAEAFDSLQSIFGKRAVDQVLPHLLNLLRTEDEAETALAALLTLLTDNTRSNIILPNLVPTLITSPMTSFNAKALSSLAEVAGSAMTRRLPTILTALMDNIITCKEGQLKEELESAFDTIMSSLDENDGLNTAMSVMFGFVKHNNEHKRAAAANRLQRFIAGSEIDFSRYNQDIIRVLLLAFDDRDKEVVQAAWSALSELMKRLRKEEMEGLVLSTRQIIQQVGVAGHDLPGFCLPKGINAVLPIFLQGLMNGTAEQRTQAALAISDIIDRTSPEALKPFVTNITGPLIRVVSERAPELKSAILLTLNNLLEKIPLFLKPFLPQLQRTFAKSLADPNSEILRSRAAKALGTLLTLKPRVDPLIAELVTGSKTPDSGVRNAMVKALYEVVSKSGDTMSETSRSSILGLIDTEPAEGDDSAAITNARLLGALVKALPADQSSGLIKQRALVSRATYASVLSLNAILLEAPETLASNFAQETPAAIATGIAHPTPAIADHFVLAAGKYLLSQGEGLAFERGQALYEVLAGVIAPGKPADTRRLSLVVVRTLARRHPAAVRPHLPTLAPPVFASVRDTIIPIKLAAEAAFLALFDVVEAESEVFEKYMVGPGAKDLPPNTKRSMQDYFRRVALRLAAQARERREAEGGVGGLDLSKDEAEDEREIWAIGKVELGDVFAND